LGPRPEVDAWLAHKNKPIPTCVASSKRATRLEVSQGHQTNPGQSSLKVIEIVISCHVAWKGNQLNTFSGDVLNINQLEILCWTQ